MAIRVELPGELIKSVFDLQTRRTWMKSEELIIGLCTCKMQQALYFIEQRDRIDSVRGCRETKVVIVPGGI